MPQCGDHPRGTSKTLLHCIAIFFSLMKLIGFIRLEFFDKLEINKSFERSSCVRSSKESNATADQIGGVSAWTFPGPLRQRIQPSPALSTLTHFLSFT